MTMSLSYSKVTSIRTYKVSSMSKGRVVKGVVVAGYCVFVAHSHSKPIAGVFLDLEGHFARFVAFLLQGGF